MSAALRLTLLLVLLGCCYLFLSHPYWFPAGASAQAAAVDHQFKIALYALGAMFVAGQLVLILVLGKRRSPQEKVSRENWKLEAAWTLGIAILFFWFNVSGERLWAGMMLPEKRAGQIQVEVTGAQFQWYFRYPGPDGIWGRTDAQKFARAEEGNPLGLDPGDPAGRDDIVSTSLVAPAGREVQLTLRAQDVIHSLFIPAMRFKQDTVPGMEIHSHLMPMQPGRYEIACAELCGIGHYRMRAEVKVVSEEDFEKWLKSQATNSN